MTTTGRVAALATCVLLVVGCGGGSSTPSSPATAPKTVATGNQIATASLTIKYPATFHQATFASGTSAKNRRLPAYVNPSPGPYTGNIYIWVDGTLVVNTPPDQYSADGSQSFSLPIYAVAPTVSTHTIVAVETKGGVALGADTILAIGESDIPASSITVGGSLSVALTMQQNITAIGLMSDPSDNNHDAYIGSPFTGAYEDFCSAPGELNVYAFGADPTGGFAASAGTGNYNSSYGVGGTALPSLTSWSNVTGTSPANSLTVTNGGLNTGYSITFNDIYGGGVLLNLSVAEPAAAIRADALLYSDGPTGYYPAGNGTYPGIERLYFNGTLPITTLEAASTLTTTIEVDPVYYAC